METQQLIDEINALPEPARLAIERLVLVLRQQPATKTPPILRPALPLTEEEIAAENKSQGGWSDRPDITDGAQYIHDVRRGLRRP